MIPLQTKGLTLEEISKLFGDQVVQVEESDTVLHVEAKGEMLHHEDLRE